MNDLTDLVKAVVLPYLAIYFGTIIGLLALANETAPTEIWGVFLGALSAMGIKLGYNAVKK